MEDRLGLDFYGMDEEKERERQRSNAEGEIKNRTKKENNERKEEKTERRSGGEREKQTTLRFTFLLSSSFFFSSFLSAFFHFYIKRLNFRVCPATLNIRPESRAIGSHPLMCRGFFCCTPTENTNRFCADSRRGVELPPLFTFHHLLHFHSLFLHPSFRYQVFPRIVNQAQLATVSYKRQSAEVSH